MQKKICEFCEKVAKKTFFFPVEKGGCSVHVCDMHFNQLNAVNGKTCEYCGYPTFINNKGVTTLCHAHI